MANQPTPSFGGKCDPLIRTILRQYRRSEFATDDSGYGRFNLKGAIDGDFGPASRKALRDWITAGCP
jgi:peptidoglycan hydrolase-like protein with peptidoglycan-binding domain